MPVCQAIENKKRFVRRIKVRKNVFQDQLIERFNRFKTHIAVKCGPRTLTYVELEKRSNYIAHWILNKNVEPGTFIGILVDDRVDFILLMIGILKARCVFVPLDPAYPLHWLKEMINATDLGLVISDTPNCHRFITGDTSFKAGEIEFILSDSILSQETELSGGITSPEISYHPEDKIYIYFTSGTSGKPRAIVGKNKSLLHFINWEIETFHIENNDFRVSQLIAPGFDASLRDIFVPLSSGGCVCIPPNKEILLHEEQLRDWLHRSRIHLIHCVPSVFRFLNTAPLTADYFPELKYILLSGEKINPADLVKWYDTFGERVQLVNLYGPTETTMVKTCYFIRQSDLNKEKIPIGKAMKGARVLVCNEKLEICDELEIGEIYIRTPFGTFGYYKEPELNRQRFIKNPFSDDPGDILYRTGDLGKYLPDGNIELMGRIDRQVKIRGIRIELEEIEHLLLQHPLVREAVVIKTEFSHQHEFLAAFVTAAEGNDNREEDLVTCIREHLSQKLPDYIVPARIIKMEKLPVTPNGKVDYKALSSAATDEAVEGKNAAPANAIEKKLLEIWTNILPVDHAGTTDSFFELGGNSLNIMALLSQIHMVFDVRIPLGDIFNNPTIEKQARLIHQANEEQFYSIEPAELKVTYDLSSAQKRLYVMHQIDETGTGCNLPIVMILEGDIHKTTFEDILKRLIRRHESFRTSFEVNEGEPVQRIHPEVELEIQYDDLRVAGINDRSQGEKEVESWIKDFIRPFDLSRAPLLRVGLIKTGVDRHILMVDMHHIITDGVSQTILPEDFIRLYSGAELPTLKLQYKDYSQWENGSRQQETLAQQEAWWLNRFAGDIPVLQLPYDYRVSEAQSIEGSAVKFEIGERETLILKEMARFHDATLFMVLLTIYNILLYRVTGQEDLVVGVPVAGRRHPDLDRVVGMFVNTLPIRNFLHPETTFSDFLKEVKARTIEVFENQDYPYEKLVDKLDLNRAGGNALISALFELQNIPVKEMVVPGLKARPYPFETKVAMFPLILTAMEVENSIHFSMEYAVNLFREERIQRFITFYKEILEAITGKKNIQLKDIRISHDFVDIETDNLEEIQGDFGF
jgi:amino acid adenylation domain-containing protein